MFANYSHYQSRMTIDTNPRHVAGPATVTLQSLQKGQTAHVVGFKACDPELEIRLREIGFAEGDSVEPLHWGLFGRNPMTVRLNGALIAMRKNEAALVLVKIAVETAR